MIRYISRRLLNLIPTFFLATLLAWVVIDIAPGDFATKFALNQRDPNQQERVRELLGLNEPMLVRYVYWLRNVVTSFDFGVSLTSRSEVTNVIVPRMLNSLWLLLPATVISYLVAIPIGIYSALIKIGIAGQADIGKIAGPVGEALIMTAIGLFVAVPAVLAYNWLQARNKSIARSLSTFSNDVLGYISSGGRVKPAVTSPAQVGKPAPAAMKK